MASAELVDVDCELIEKDKAIVACRAVGFWTLMPIASFTQGSEAFVKYSSK